MTCYLEHQIWLTALHGGNVTSESSICTGPNNPFNTEQTTGSSWLILNTGHPLGERLIPLDAILPVKGFLPRATSIPVGTHVPRAEIALGKDFQKRVKKSQNTPQCGPTGRPLLPPPPDLRSRRHRQPPTPPRTSPSLWMKKSSKGLATRY
jgi:hypothetical protein